MSLATETTQPQRRTLSLKRPVQLIPTQIRQRGSRVVVVSAVDRRRGVGSGPERAKRAALRWLKVTYPAFKRSLPLQLGAFDLIAPAAARAGISLVAIRAAIAKHVSSRRYLTACAKPGSRRFDLFGQPICRVEKAHREHAARRLATVPPPKKRSR